MPVTKRARLTALMAKTITECLCIGMSWEEIFVETRANENIKLSYLSDLKSELIVKDTKRDF